MSSAGARDARVRWALVLALAAWSCTDGPTTPAGPQLEVVVASGSGQYGALGQTLPHPLRVLVRGVDDQLPEEDVVVRWVVEGDAEVVGIAATPTDSTGTAQVEVELGATPGPINVTASLQDQPSVSASLQVFAVNPPELESVSVAEAEVGDVITLTGENFSPIAEDNIVLFSGIRGAVVSASTTELSVEVPACLPTRDVDVSVQLGVVVSDVVTLSVLGNAGGEALTVGAPVDIVDDAGFECLRLPGGPDVAYLAIVHSASTVGAGHHSYKLTGLSSAGSILPLAPSGAPARAAAAQGGASIQDEWEMAVRALERELPAPEPSVGEPSGPARAPAATPPQVGAEREFYVLSDRVGITFDTVTATARYVGAHAALFVDEEAPDGGYTDADLQAFSEVFDAVIEPAVTDAFGEASDLDNNQRIIILFTPTVNRLTPRESDSFVGGFFYGRDLLPQQPNSNQGEVFYTLVPDPTGQFSGPRDKDDLLAAVPGVLAHEFQHMINFNERVLLEEATTGEALWLSEALAQMAEEVVARAYEEMGDADGAELFRQGNRIRAQRYLERTDTVSALAATGVATLPERGAGFLHVLYLDAQYGEGILAELTRTKLTGISNVEAETGREWEDLVADWWTAVYFDGSLPEPGPLTYPGVDLRGFFGDPFPLSPTVVGGSDFTRSGSLWSSSVRYLLITPPSSGSVSIRLGGAGGGELAPEASMHLRIVRIS